MNAPKKDRGLMKEEAVYGVLHKKGHSLLDMEHQE